MGGLGCVKGRFGIVWGRFGTLRDRLVGDSLGAFWNVTGAFGGGLKAKIPYCKYSKYGMVSMYAQRH